MDIPEKEWQKVNLSIPKRKYNHVSVHENDVKMSNCKNTFRQIIIKDQGRSKPTFIITNNNDLELREIIVVIPRDGGYRANCQNWFHFLISMPCHHR